MAGSLSLGLFLGAANLGQGASLATLLEGFEVIGEWSASGTGAALAADDWHLQGAKSIKLTTALAPGSFAAATKTGAWDISKGGVAVLLLDAPNGDNVAPAIYFSSTAFAGSKWLTKAPGAPNSLVRGAQGFAFDIDGMTVSGGESKANLMTTLRARIDTTPGGSPSVKVDALYLGAKSRPQVIIGFDDGWATQYTAAYPYLQSKGLKGTFYVIKSTIGAANYCTLAQIQEMHADGHDIANHTVNHVPFNSGVVDAICASQTPTAGALTINGTLASGGQVVLAEPRHISIVPTANEAKYFTITGELGGVVKSEIIGSLNGVNVTATVGLFDKVTGVTISANAAGPLTIGIARTQADVQSDLEEVRDWLVGAGMARAAAHVAYPQGESNPSSDAAMAAAGMISGRSTRNANEVTYFGHLNRFQSPGRSGSVSRSTVLSYVDEAIATGTTLHLLYHRIEGSTTGIFTSVADYEAEIDYIAAKRDAGLIDVVTISDWYNRVTARARPF